MNSVNEVDLERVPVPTSLTAQDVSLLVRALDLATDDEVLEHDRRDRVRSHLFESLMEAQFKHAGPKPSVLNEFAAATIRDALRERQWAVDQAASACYEPTALLALGDDRYVAMSAATADHLIRHLGVSLGCDPGPVYDAKRVWIIARLDQLRERACTLRELEESAG